MNTIILCNKVGFLVGHTHKHIDQLFSCISWHLKHWNALTVQGTILFRACDIL